MSSTVNCSADGGIPTYLCADAQVPSFESVLKCLDVDPSDLRAPFTAAGSEEEGNVL